MFEIGDKVWFRNGHKDLQAVIVGFGLKDDEAVYDVKVDGQSFLSWGYADQFRAR